MLFISSRLSIMSCRRSGSRGSPPLREESQRRKTPRTDCIACGEAAILGKRLCEKCLQEVAGPSSDQLHSIKDWMQTTIKKSMSDMVNVVTEKVLHNLDERHKAPSSMTEVSDRPHRNTHYSSVSEGELSLTDQEEEEQSEDTCSFNLEYLEPLIKAMRFSLELDNTEDTPKHDKMFRSAVKKGEKFPVHRVIKETILEEWKTPDKKLNFSRRLKKMYPFEEEDSKLWQASPKVDAAITRVARRTTLPVDEGVSLKDAMERRQDMTLKKSYLTCGMSNQASIAITTLARANHIWIEELEQAVKAGTDRKKLIEMIQDVKTANEFTTEASMDLVRLSAKAMGLSVAARRALWLRHWHADPQSKHNLCSLPFEGSLLFGERLDKIISKASAGKSAFLPQDKRDKRPFRKNPLQEAKQYRPGKPFTRQPWRRTQGQGAPGRRDFKQDKKSA
ncbi:uncharacterized protein LOC121402927 isoform X2 [Xenopus laevis]|uniref:Uncharacterized protein LOC121396568 isoform X2 n=2 Tax=Xenopus laevis TaxID=8355 RepID=A0A8J1M871_XENLA|nr:uncharacterized protein LOC121396568 isoform X2 [Xenopus laevis]XP_041437902.1 uncharacterized protein LOC121399949 isoform X2 [Xenopus laevis]XP_041445812.1 uncharacterized protein LOC121402927 isoform X2 [Xenopus laevis]